MTNDTEVSIDVTQAELNELDAMVVAGGFADRADLANNAFTMLKWAIGHAKAGHVVAALDQTAGRLWEPQMPCLKASL